MAKRKKLSMSSIEMRMSHRYRSYGLFCATLLFSTIREGERDSSERFHQDLINVSSGR